MLNHPEGAEVPLRGHDLDVSACFSGAFSVLPFRCTRFAIPALDPVTVAC